MTSPVAASLRHLKLRHVAVAGVIGAAFVLTGCGGGSGSPSAAKASTTTHAASSAASAAHSIAAAQAALVTLANAWVSARNTEVAANQTATAASNNIVADETKQNQRIQQDQTTVQQDEFGLACDSQITSPTYSTCVVGDDQAATNAQKDEAAANAQLQTDSQQLTTNASTYGAAISTFLGQIADMPWPNSMQSIVTNLVTTAQTFRADVSDLGSLPSSGTQAQAGIDVGSFADAISAVNSELLHLGASLQTS